MGDTKTDLIDLHLDCLECIVELITAYDIGHLWLSGSTVLQMLLSEGGAAKKLNFEFEPYYPLLWPRLVCHLPHLTHFSLKVDHRNKNYEPFDWDCTLLPRKIRFLDLELTRSFIGFNKALLDDPTRFAHLETLYIGGLVGVDIVPDLSMLTNLNSLCIRFQSKGYPPLHDIVLPPNLTDLELTLSESAVEKVLPKLPATLTRLGLLLAKYCTIWQYLPPDLLKLTVVYWDTAVGDVFEEDLSEVPQNLHSLTLWVPMFSPTMASQIPRSVTDLSILTDTSLSKDDYLKIFPLLPPNVVSLGGALRPADLGPELSKAIPRTLKDEFKDVSMDAIEYLPQKTISFETIFTYTIADLTKLHRFTNLTYLSLKDVNHELLPIIPRTLTTLRCQMIEPLTAAGCTLLPPHLTELSVYGSPIEINAIQSLPRALNLLRCKLSGSVGFNTKILTTLPLLTRLHLQHENGLVDVLNKCPSTLTDLVVVLKTATLDWVASLPNFKNLLYLEVESAHLVFVNARLLLQNLPNRLVEFAWVYQDADLTIVDLNFLPRGLTMLDIPFDLPDQLPTPYLIRKPRAPAYFVRVY